MINQNCFIFQWDYQWDDIFLGLSIPGIGANIGFYSEPAEVFVNTAFANQAVFKPVSNRYAESLQFYTHYGKHQVKTQFYYFVQKNEFCLEGKPMTLIQGEYRFPFFLLATPSIGKWPTQTSKRTGYFSAPTQSSVKNTGPYILTISHLLE